MAVDTTISIRVNSELKTEAEGILSELGMTVSGVYNMLLKQIVRERAVPLSLSLDSSNAVYVDLLEAQNDRVSGYVGRTSDEVLEDIQKIICKAKADEQI